jgi:hypothetical protein
MVFGAGSRGSDQLKHPGVAGHGGPLHVLDAPGGLAGEQQVFSKDHVTEACK